MQFAAIFFAQPASERFGINSDIAREQRGMASAIRTSSNRPAEPDERGGAGLPD
jgi:hypothetical protein